MKNYIQAGDNVTLTAPRTLVSGDGFMAGSLFAVASTDAASGENVEGVTKGVVVLPKATPLAISQGDPVYWDNTAFKVNKTSTNPLIGVCVAAAGSSATTVYVRLNSGYYPSLDQSVQVSADVTISSSELLLLNTTPKTLVAAPGAGLALVPIGLLLFLDYATTAYDGIAAGEDLALKYTDASGTQIMSVETTGFLDATADALRWAPAPTTLLTPTANAALVLHMLTGNIATGDSPLKVRTFYKVLPTTL